MWLFNLVLNLHRIIKPVLGKDNKSETSQVLWNVNCEFVWFYCAKLSFLQSILSISVALFHVACTNRLAKLVKIGKVSIYNKIVCFDA